MKKSTVTLIAGALLLLTAAAHAELQGSWTIKRVNRAQGELHIELERDRNQLGQNMDLADFTGLAAAQLAAGTPTAVSFSLRREAGTVEFTGEVGNDRGRGDFSFTANPAYLAALEGLGVRADRGKKHGQSADERLLSLAVLDVSTDFIRSMQAAGYRESLDDYIAMRIFGVDPDLVADFRALGMELDVDELVAGQIHGVTPEYVREMRELHGARLDHDELVATRIHGATPEFIAEMAEHGYGDLDGDDYVAFRIHGVTPGFVEELAELGYRDVDADDLIAFRIHGVTPAMIRELQEDGHTDVSPDDLVAMRIHGRNWRR